MKKILAGLVGAICIVYIINPTAGLIELIPDNAPFIGNLDEAGVTAILIQCIRMLVEKGDKKKIDE